MAATGEHSVGSRKAVDADGGGRHVQGMAAMKSRSTLGIRRAIAVTLFCALPWGLAQGQTKSNGQGAANVPADAVARERAA